MSRFSNIQPGYDKLRHGYVNMVIDDYDTDFDDFDDDQISPDRTPPKSSAKSIPDRAMIGLRTSATSVEQVQEEAPGGSQTPPDSPTRAFSKLSLNSSTKSRRRSRRSNPSRFVVDRPEVFQSITCVPTLRHFSFEELRHECYMISFVTRDRPPMSAGMDEILSPPWRPFVDDGDSEADVARRARAASMDVLMPASDCILSLDDSESIQGDPSNEGRGAEFEARWGPQEFQREPLY